jgi:hypothetical protein
MPCNVVSRLCISDRMCKMQVQGSGMVLRNVLGGSRSHEARHSPTVSVFHIAASGSSAKYVVSPHMLRAAAALD